MARFDTSQIHGSIDTLEFARYCDHLPCEEELIEREFSSKRGRFPGTKTWCYNGESNELKELKVTIYPTWDAGRIRVGASLPKVLKGHNVGLIDAPEIYEALDILGRRLTMLLGFPFDVLTSLVQRIDYAVNLRLEPSEIATFFRHFSNFGIPRLIRRTLSSESESIYFENKSREIVLYDKRGEMLRKLPDNNDQLKFAEGLIRIESRFLNEKTIKRYRAKFGVDEHTVAALVTPRQVSSATKELIRLLQLDQVELSKAGDFRSLVSRLEGDIKSAISLSGFQNAVAEYGPDFYRDPAFGYSKSTYDRNRRQLQQLGLPLSV